LPAKGTTIEISMKVLVSTGEQVLVFPSRVTWVDHATHSIGVTFSAPARWEARS
jgi:hypothetical protein